MSRCLARGSRRAGELLCINLSPRHLPPTYLPAKPTEACGIPARLAHAARCATGPDSRPAEIGRRALVGPHLAAAPETANSRGKGAWRLRTPRCKRQQTMCRWSAALRLPCRRHGLNLAPPCGGKERLARDSPNRIQNTPDCICPSAHPGRRRSLDAGRLLLILYRMAY